MIKPFLSEIIFVCSYGSCESHMRALLILREHLVSSKNQIRNRFKKKFFRCAVRPRSLVSSGFVLLFCDYRQRSHTWIEFNGQFKILNLESISCCLWCTQIMLTNNMIPQQKDLFRAFVFQNYDYNLSNINNSKTIHQLRAKKSIN